MFSEIHAQMTKSQADTGPTKIDYRTGITTSKTRGETSFTENYYYDFTSSKTIGYFYADNTVIITPGKAKRDQR